MSSTSPHTKECIERPVGTPCICGYEHKEDWEEKLKEFKYDDYSHKDDDRPCASNYTVIGNKYHGNGEKRPCDCGADSRWNELCSFFRTQISLAEERGRRETITTFVEEIKKIRFHMNIEEYLPMVQAWDKKNYDKPFDDGYAKAKVDLLAFADSLKSNLTQKS